MDKSYIELLQETLSKIYELKDLNNIDRGKALTIFIGEHLDRELLLSSQNIFSLFSEIINLDDPVFIADLRKTEWYGDWFNESNNKEKINLSVIPYRDMYEYEKIEYLSNSLKYDFESLKDTESFTIFDILKETKDIDEFCMACNNIVINHGFFDNKDYNIYDIPDEFIENDSISIYMCILNIENKDFIPSIDDLDVRIISILEDIKSNIKSILTNNLTKSNRSIVR